MEERNVEELNRTDSNLEATMEELKEQAQDSMEDEIKNQFQRMKEEKEEINGKFLRMTADFQNYKKRVEKEKSDIYSFANEKLILDILPIVDNFERALHSSSEEVKGESFIKGIEMIFQQFGEMLKKNGVQEIDALGNLFDPNFHHAVMQEDHADYESNTVIDVFQKGYTLNEKVIRPAMVKVAN